MCHCRDRRARSCRGARCPAWGGPSCSAAARSWATRTSSTTCRAASACGPGRPLARRARTSREARSRCTKQRLRRAGRYHSLAMSHHAGALATAAAQVAAVRDDPAARLALMAQVFHGPTGRAPRHLPFRRAALSFMRWQVRRGLLEPLDASPPGSAWWRAVNERLLRDGCETVALLGGPAGEPSSQAVRAVAGVRRRARPARNWYRAHNASIVAAYLEHRDLAEAESAAERFFMNVALLRVLYAHALVAAPRLALGRLRSARPRARRSPARDGRGVPLAAPRAAGPLPAGRRRRALHRRRAAPRPDARLRGDRAAAAAALRVVRRGARRAARCSSWSATATRSTPGPSRSATSGALRT